MKFSSRSIIIQIKCVCVVGCRPNIEQLQLLFVGWQIFELTIIRTFCILPTSMYLSPVPTDTQIERVFGLGHRQWALARCHGIFLMPTQSNNSSSLKFYQDIYLNFHRHNDVFVSCLLCWAFLLCVDSFTAVCILSLCISSLIMYEKFAFCSYFSLPSPSKLYRVIFFLDWSVFV